MSIMTSQIIYNLSICLTVCSTQNKTKHQSSALLAFLREIHRSPVVSPNKGPVLRRAFPYQGAIIRSWLEIHLSWWHHRMETLSALLAICAGNSPVTGEFPAQWTVTRSFDIFFDLRLNKRFNKQSRDWWFETSSGPFWRHCNDDRIISLQMINATCISVGQGLGTACDTFFSQVSPNITQLKT